jgi:heme/copper-type cytochrome/quinol oxidase subunit 1
MPTLSQWTVKLSLVHFVLGIVLGATMLAAKAGFGDLGLLNHRATHIHLMFFGWLVQLVVGVGYWILPKFSDGPKRGTPRLAAASIVVLNVGAVCGTASPWVPLLGMTGWTLETIACGLFAAHVWPRIKGFGG